MQNSVYLVFNICIACYILFVSSKNLRVEGGKSILYFSSAILFYYTANLLAFSIPSLIRTSLSVVFFGKALAVTALFILTLKHTRGPNWLVRYTLIFFAAETIITQILYWAPDNSRLIQNAINFFTISSAFSLSGKINSLYNYSLITATVSFLANPNRFSKNKSFRSDYFKARFWAILIGPLIAWIAQGLLLLSINNLWIEPIFLLSLNLSALGFAINAFQIDRTSKLTLSRDNVVEKMEDGWIVTDAQNIIVDYNETTAKFLGKTKNNLYGVPLQSIFSDIPNLEEIFHKNREVDLDSTLAVDNEYRFLNIRISSLLDNTGYLSGRLVIWRDITNRRQAEEARQKARDEMFVLLNAIASSASQTTSLSEFLSETIYQIIYPFRSQLILIYLQDERGNSAGKGDYYLASSIGLSAENQKALEKLSSSTPFSKWIEENKHPLLMEELQDTRIPPAMKSVGMLYLLAVPMQAQTPEGQDLIGVLFLGRKIKLPYTPDDVVRLTMISDQIAALIDSDRRRKLAIALSERQRLMRDIHDSVSQKLYGLLAITEAAQAAIEAGDQPDYDRILSWVGDNARQAVKELRLFLFQLQPIDLEKEGLVSILHHRLAAVEGRADIKARFLADETISLSKRRQIALYYIAQEALNNVLRHAKAKSVNVTLKEGYKYVTLEIADDGCGFDKKNMNHGGLGIKNITERVKQEKGKIKISSEPGKGTNIIVSFEKDDDSKS